MSKHLVRILLIVAPLFVAACSAENGDRCNPSQYSDNGIQGNCNDGYACVYPTTYPDGPACGVAYCCAIDGDGHITDDNPNCQPDPSLAPVCMIDLGLTTTD